MSLKDSQKNALANLSTLLKAEPSLGIREVHTDVPGNISPTCCVVRESPDGGMEEQRGPQWRIVRWDLDLDFYIAESRLVQGQQAARDLRADVLDRLATDITLGGKVSNSQPRGLWRIADLAWGKDEGSPVYVAIRGGLTLWIKEAVSYA